MFRSNVKLQTVVLESIVNETLWASILRTFIKLPVGNTATWTLNSDITKEKGELLIVDVYIPSFSEIPRGINTIEDTN